VSDHNGCAFDRGLDLFGYCGKGGRRIKHSFVMRLIFVISSLTGFDGLMKK
jgi:hypothetical protein